MGLGLSDVTNAIKRGEHDVARAIGQTLIDAGHESTDLIRSTLNRLPGGLKLGSRLVGGGRPRTPMQPHLPHDLPAPHPSDYVVERGATTCSVNGAGKPFCLNGFKSLAAGAQTQGTDLVNFHAAASNPTIITSDNIIPGSVDIREASLSISARAVVTLGFEGVGFLESFYLIEYINGIEWARWPLRKLASMIGYTGSLGTGFGQSSTARLDLPGIPWPRKYDPNTPYKTALQCSVTTTTVNALDCSFVETGYRP